MKGGARRPGRVSGEEVFCDAANRQPLSILRVHGVAVRFSSRAAFDVYGARGKRRRPRDPRARRARRSACNGC